ncbi:hypothetical protein CNMCM5793_005392 [Aspergillus hiratsukae]|uniref:SnoaL-like domain-containing protein n=1 Tax=Aspergillus hiratsukae TaxID=1194566 RepID=A0A8H6PG34_9EURO|nr:hypothetical protein CNMCM5793_005392 [Aspergillus hiratsukae]KAF7166312.1 hypothetical protein CNMCM6106_002170 [Aspergillus hiratsukae]
MSYVTENTKWMSDQITGNTKDLVARFYELADSKQSDAGQLMATEVFSEDAVLFTPGGTYKGFTEISKCRDNAWATVTSRKHTLSKVFSGHGDKDTEELVLFGSVRMTLSKGESHDSAFVAHIKLKSSAFSAIQPRISSMEVYAITSPSSA